MPKEATIDKDLYDGLQQARKKKPRYFALIAKGPDVVGLIVQKKAINDGLAQKAKSETKGNLVIQGVCHGEGVDLKFEVVGAEPSILPKKIKDFIDERTELALKAQWVVVTQLSAVPDDESKPPANGSQPTASQPAAAQPAPDLAAFQAKARQVGAAIGQLKDSNPFRAGLAQRLNVEVALVGSTPANVPGGMKTLAVLEQETKGALEFAARAGAVYFAIEALNEHEPLRGQLMYSWNAEITSARNSSATVSEYLPGSLQRLAALEQQAKSKLPGQPAPQAASQQPAAQPAKEPAKEPAKTGTPDQYKAWQARLKGLLIRQKELFAKEPALREKLLPFSQPASTLTMRASLDAPAALDKLEQALNEAEGTGQQPAVQQEAPAAGGNPMEQQWNEQYARLEPRYLQVMSTNPPNATQIRGVMFYATEQATAGAYEKGLAALKRLEPMLVAVTGPAPVATKTAETKPQTVQPAASEPTVAGSADELKKQLAELRMRLEQMVGGAPLDQLSQVMALQEKAETPVKEAFIHLEANDLTKAAASIEALRNLLDGKPAASSAAAEPAAKQPEAKQPAATQPETSSQPAESESAGAASADELRKQLADLRMRLELMEGDAPIDQLDQITALKNKAEPLVNDVFVQLDASDLTKAAASIEALRNLLDGKPAASSAAAEPAARQPGAKQPETSSQPAETKPTAAASADELRKQLAELRMRLEQMVGGAPLDQLSQVMALQEKAEPLVKEGFVQLEANDLTKAAASIEVLRTLLDGKPAAGAAATATPEAKQLETQAEAKQPEVKQPGASTQPAASEPKAATTADELRKQLAELRTRLEHLEGDAQPDQMAQVMALKQKAEPLVKGCFVHLEANDLAKAAASIEALRRLLNGEPAEALAVDLAAIAARWRTAQDAVTANLEEFRKTLLADAEIAADPRFTFVKAASVEILHMLPPDKPVSAALQSSDAAAAVAAVQTYRQVLDATESIGLLEEFALQNLKFKIAARTTLTAALSEIESSLKQAA